MIRYPAQQADIESAVAAIDPKWMKKASTRTARLVKSGCYNEASSIWSTVKPVYMALQSNKCLFCERQFESEKYGKIEFDLEHFRPKSSVKPWPVPGSALTYPYATGDESANGYYWLAYSLTNYAASCKACNTSLKSNYFPVAANRAGIGGDVASEQAYLCYPLGDTDDDPEDLVTFVGFIAVAAHGEGHRLRRGQILIDFFDLNGRDTLEIQRATMIMILGNALAAIADGTGTLDDDEIVSTCLKPHMPHAACMRAFHRQWQDDPAFARELHARAKKRFLAASK